MQLPVITMMSNHTYLTAEDKLAFRVLSKIAESHSSKKNVLTEGSLAKTVVIIESGWAIRYHVVANGERQILDFLLPGDVLYTNALAGFPLDTSVSALTPVIVSHVSITDFRRIVRERESIASAMECYQAESQRRMTSAIIRLGRRDALARVGNLLCELWTRMESVGLLDDDCLCLHATQSDMADALGLSAVHVNRMMQKLRADGLIDTVGRKVTITDLSELTLRSGFFKRQRLTVHNRIQC